MDIGLQVTFDCLDPDRLAAFWAAALPGYAREGPPGGYPSWAAWGRAHGVSEDALDDELRLVDGTGRRPALFFQRVPEGKGGKNRLHLDVNVSAGLTGDERSARIETEVRRLTGLGATVLDRRVPPERWVVMADVEGNEFCVV